MSDVTKLVAETGADGRIAWVWLQAPGARTSSARIDRTLTPAELEGAQFFGASSDAIMAWLKDSHIAGLRTKS